MDNKEQFTTRITRVRFADGTECDPADCWAISDARHGEVPTGLKVDNWAVFSFVKNCFPYTLSDGKTGMLVKIACGSKEFSIYRPNHNPYLD